MGFAKILVATDFSDDANAAVEHAAALAGRHRAELLLLHACGAPPQIATLDIWSSNKEQLEQMQELRRTAAVGQLEKIADGLRGRELNVRTLLRQGRAVQEINAAAREEDVDLIVTGARGSGGTNVFIIGSVAEGIVRRSDRNVLVARGEVTKFSKILMATDLTDASLAVIPTAMAFAAADSEVELLHVVEWGDHAPVVRGPHGAPAFDFKKLWRIAVEEADKELKRLTDSQAGRSKMSHCVTDGVAATAILERLEEGGHDLLVVGKNTDTPPLHERVAERVLRHASCPVLVARNVAGSLHLV
jgi:nucleotide-binding universal stress UspA family protein